MYDRGSSIFRPFALTPLQYRTDNYGTASTREHKCSAGYQAKAVSNDEYKAPG